MRMLTSLTICMPHEIW